MSLLALLHCGVSFQKIIELFRWIVALDFEKNRVVPLNRRALFQDIFRSPADIHQNKPALHFWARQKDHPKLRFELQ